MTDRKKNLLYLLGLLALLVLFYSRILFTDKIIRAPDIINEFYWGAKGMAEQSFADMFRFQLKAGWDHLTNGGVTNFGGTVSGVFLFPLKFIFYLFPLPASVAWCIVLHLFFGACGVFLCCRAIGASHPAAFIGGAIFALAPEMASLINAGHVMKIATICYAPWAFFFLERGFQTRRIIFFLTTGFVLAFQFFNTHWQIAFYTCLCVGMYGIIRVVGVILADRNQGKSAVARLLGLNLVVLAFFLSTVSISLIPLKNWSKDTNRGSQSGSNLGKGGLNREEAMMWSMPPEELAAFVVPGFFGLSRQEAGPNPTNVRSYYWGRMVFTQTTSYIGLLPWLLLPLPLIFRRDKYTWLAFIGIVGGILFSMGKYTPFYNLLYDHFPGINSFRVPKMMMFIPVIGLGVLAARGIDLLTDPEVRLARSFRRYLAGVVAVPLLLLLFLGVLRVWQDQWITVFVENLANPTRYEEGIYLVSQRWNNLLAETGIAALFAALTAGVLVGCARIKGLVRFAPVLLLFLYLSDVWRVNDKFMFMTDAPVKAKAEEPAPVIKFLKEMPKTYRVFPMDGSDPMQYVSMNIPVMFTSNPVQQMRWQQFLDEFNPQGGMPDIMNVKYLVVQAAEYQQQKGVLGDKFVPVFTPPGADSVVLENRSVLPKGWLVPSVMVSTDPTQRLSILQNRMFNPAKVALVESPPPFSMAYPNSAPPLPQAVTVSVYESERIVLDAASPVNSLLVLGEKYYKGWTATVDGKSAEIVPVNHILRGVYLASGKHKVEFTFDPPAFKIGKYLTLGSFAVFAGMLLREWLLRRGKGHETRLDA